MKNDLICKCGHREIMHSSLEDALKFYKHHGRMCIEYDDCINIKGVYFHSSEKICSCNNFEADNLKYLEQIYESK